MTDITRGSGNVFKDLGLENAEGIKEAADKILEKRKAALNALANESQIMGLYDD